MEIGKAQKDMCEAYVGGGTGVLISGIVWLTAGIFAIYSSQQTSILIFFLGGMLIYPLGIVVSKLFKRKGTHSKENPFGKLALESTAILFIGLFIAYAIFQKLPNWFYPIMLMIIGVRYLIFQTIYGLKVYWILGLILMTAGFICLISNQPFHLGGLIGGVIELIFSAFIIQSDRRNYKKRTLQ